jgi:hypothetical protein
VARFRVVVVRDSEQPSCDETDADRVVHAATVHAAAVLVLRSIGGGFAETIDVYALGFPSRRHVRYMYCNLFAGEFTYDVCSS